MPSPGKNTASGETAVFQRVQQIRAIIDINAAIIERCSRNNHWLGEKAYGPPPVLWYHVSMTFQPSTRPRGCQIFIGMTYQKVGEYIK
jgi:hypothetical protein